MFDSDTAIWLQAHRRDLRLGKLSSFFSFFLKGTLSECSAVGKGGAEGRGGLQNRSHLRWSSWPGHPETRPVTRFRVLYGRTPIEELGLDPRLNADAWLQSANCHLSGPR